MFKFIKSLAALAIIAAGCLATPKAACAGVFVSINIAPPVLPVYVQPPCPTPGYLWTPGYWGYAPAGGYYWVPGVWVAPPAVGLLWTPGYWGFVGGLYSFHPGYWGPHVGFYGGVNYGFGYGGFGFGGGVWAGNVFRYNTAVVNVNTAFIHNTYVDRTVINNSVVNRASFNGPGGVMRQPSPQERGFENERHFEPTANQMAHEQHAGQDRAQFASFNHGHPGVASMDRVNGQRFNSEAHMGNQQAHAAGPGARLEHQQPQNVHHEQQAHMNHPANGGGNHANQQEHRQVSHEQNRGGGGGRGEQGHRSEGGHSEGGHEHH